MSMLDSFRTLKHSRVEFINVENDAVEIYLRNQKIVKKKKNLIPLTCCLDTKACSPKTLNFYSRAPAVVLDLRAQMEALGP